MQINEPSVGPQPPPLWRLAFRAGFLVAAAFAVASMARWLLWMTSPQDWDYRLYPAWWHAHEMVFGFAMPVVAGFLLTAVATWTGIPGTRGARLQLLFGLWLLARLLLWTQPALLWLAWAAEMLFMLLLCWELGTRVWARRQWRNMPFVPVLLALALLSSASYYSAHQGALGTQAHYGAVWMIAVLVVIVGGRVTPVFTGNRLGSPIPPLPDWFETLAITLTVLIGLVTATWPGAQGHPALAGLCLAAGIVHLLRLWRWQVWRAWRIPLLWSMHLSYLCIPLAMLTLAVAGDDAAAVKNIIHLLAVGAIGGMILAMMSRVALGHTGRPLEVPAYLACAFGAVFLAAMVRALVPLLDPGLAPHAWILSALMWIAAFAAFLVRYSLMLCAPRADGKPG